MSDTSNPKNPDFDVRTATPDPRWLVSDVISITEDATEDGVLRSTDDISSDLRAAAARLQKQLKAKNPDETMELFVLVVEQAAGMRVVVGYGFSHNPLPDESDAPGE